MTNDSSKPKDSPSEPRNQPNPFMKYSGMGVQMAIFIGLGAWGGQYLDKHFETKTPWWTVGLCLLGVTGSLYLLIKQVINDSK